MRASTSALVVAQEAATAEWAEFIALSPENARLARIARQICKNAQHDPDVVTMGRPAIIPQIGAKGSIVVVGFQPQWVLFLSDAEAALRAVENAGVIRTVDT